MGLRTDRPAAGGEDGVAVHVARSLDEARRARDGLVKAGVACDLPDAALEALFAEPGGASITIKVKGKDLSRALDVIEDLFPREVIDLPPLPEPPRAPGAPGASPPAEPGRAGPTSGEPDLDAASERAQGPKLRRLATRLLVTGLGSLVLPGLGLLLGVIAMAGGVWALGQANAVTEVREHVRPRALVAMLLGALGVVAQALIVRSWLRG